MPSEIKEHNKKFYEQLHKGMLVKGKVKNIQPYGAFVELQKGIVGLLHIEDISVSRIKSPEDIIKVGDVIVTMIKNKKKGKSSCGCNCAHCAMAGSCHKK